MHPAISRNAQAHGSEHPGRSSVRQVHVIMTRHQPDRAHRPVLWPRIFRASLDSVSWLGCERAIMGYISARARATAQPIRGALQVRHGWPGGGARGYEGEGGAR